MKVLVKKMGIVVVLCCSLLVAVGCGKQSGSTEQQSSESAQKISSEKAKKASSESAKKASSESAKKASSESAQKASSESAKKASSESAQKASSESAKKASSESAKKANNLIDSSLIGTWYGYNEYESKLDTINITGNKIITNGNVTELHLTSERTAADKALLAGSSTAGNSKVDTYKESHWGSFVSLHGEDGRKWLDVRGWYQSAGAGSYYGVKNRVINGRSIPVLTIAGGAGIWASQHFYQDKADANKMSDTMFDDEPSQN